MEESSLKGTVPAKTRVVLKLTRTVDGSVERFKSILRGDFLQNVQPSGWFRFHPDRRSCVHAEGVEYQRTLFQAGVSQRATFGGDLLELASEEVVQACKAVHEPQQSAIECWKK